MFWLLSANSRSSWLQSFLPTGCYPTIGIIWIFPPPAEAASLASSRVVKGAWLAGIKSPASELGEGAGAERLPRMHLVWPCEPYDSAVKMDQVRGGVLTSHFRSLMALGAAIPRTALSPMAAMIRTVTLSLMRIVSPTWRVRTSMSISFPLMGGGGLAPRFPCPGSSLAASVFLGYWRLYAVPASLQLILVLALRFPWIAAVSRCP